MRPIQVGPSLYLYRLPSKVQVSGVGALALYLRVDIVLNHFSMKYESPEISCVEIV